MGRRRHWLTRKNWEDTIFDSCVVPSKYSFDERMLDLKPVQIVQLAEDDDIESICSFSVSFPTIINERTLQRSIKLRKVNAIEEWHRKGWPSISAHLRNVIMRSLLKDIAQKSRSPLDPEFYPYCWYAPDIGHLKKWLWGRKLEWEEIWDEEAILEMANVLET